MRLYNTREYKLLSGEIGRIEFRLQEDAVGNDEYFLTWAYMDLKGDHYKRQGIGRAALKCPVGMI